MSITRRIFVSLPADNWLTAAQNDLKWGVVERIEQLGYTPEIFTDPTPGRISLSAGLSWSAANVEEIARRCHGAAIIGLPRWIFEARDGWFLMPTEYSHYEGALARTLGLPILILAQDNLMKRAVFDWQFGSSMGIFPDGADRSWLNTNEFKVRFDQWRNQLEARRDVFLGYCGASSKTAKKVRSFLEKQAGTTVLDWKRDFTPGRSILDQIQEASNRCTAGIFLFTKDDELLEASDEQQAAPRDNVVFEAGYFASVKGKQRVLIIREKGSKMPADLGGDIYAFLEDRNNISTIKDSINKFVENL